MLYINTKSGDYLHYKPTSDTAHLYIKQHSTFMTLYEFMADEITGEWIPATEAEQAIYILLTHTEVGYDD